MMLDESCHSHHWPAEWQAHAATWMAFPCRQMIWSHGLVTAQKAYAKVANLISEHEPVNMLVRAADLERAKSYLSESIRLIIADLDDSWARDTAPIWIIEEDAAGEKNLVAIDFEFNGWGEKFSPINSDKTVAAQVARDIGCQRIMSKMVLEGGAIHGNGNGRLLTTKECLLHANRNPKMMQSNIEKELSRFLGVDEFIWLEKGLTGDIDTDGHVDNIACFVDRDTVITQSCEPGTENFEIYQANKAIMERHRLEVIELPEPIQRYHNTQRMPLSYVNFYTLNDAVILPQFGDKNDQRAISIIRECFSNRKIYAVDANEIVVGGGGIHCITMQQPAIDNV